MQLVWLRVRVTLKPVKALQTANQGLIRMRMSVWTTLILVRLLASL